MKLHELMQSISMLELLVIFQKPMVMAYDVSTQSPELIPSNMDLGEDASFYFLHTCEAELPERLALRLNHKSPHMTIN
jgi:hypothetical protein